MKSGKGTAGVLQWRNTARPFMYLSSPNDDDRRTLDINKINYAKQTKTEIQYQNGVFVPIGAGSPHERAAAEAPIDETFMRCLDAAVAQGRTVSDSSGRNYAPTLFENMPEAKGTTKRAFELAMPRLFTAGKIKVQTEGRGGHAKKRLTRA
jgi:hypothetical protein